ncbi:uncharacterized protein LOC129589228 [Paramacrobiotus metropolitanus]|uniref:uncharacterized protein LOC129589228 n=1 Tax=Paramacrobiotus metropolitanus TaxID=2943436 RepID=UPI00244615F7|nr:uncharacterized protein LOC129589228 [Paramacrobiotus metropolitanus]
MMMKMMTEKERKPNPAYPHVIDEVANQTHMPSVRTSAYTLSGGLSQAFIQQPVDHSVASGRTYDYQPSPALPLSVLSQPTLDNLATVSPRLQSSPIEKQQATKYYHIDSSRNANVVAGTAAAQLQPASTSSSADIINGPAELDQVSCPRTPPYNTNLHPYCCCTDHAASVECLNHYPASSVVADQRHIAITATHVIPPRIFQLGDKDSIVNESDIDQDVFIIPSSAGSVGDGVDSVDDSASRVSTLDSPTLSASSLQPLAGGVNDPRPIPPVTSLVNAKSRPKKKVVFLRSPVMPPRDGNGGGQSTPVGGV